MSNIDSVIAVIPVTNQTAAVTWYGKWLGREPDIVPVDTVAEWQLAENAWLQITLDPERAGKTTAILGVRDIDTQQSICREAGITLSDVVVYPDIVRTVDARDPDGNQITFVQDISGEA